MSFEFQFKRRVNPGDTCIVVGFSFEVPGSISNMTRTVIALNRLPGDEWSCCADDREKPLKGADESGKLSMPDKWLIPIAPSAGETQRPRTLPIQPAFA